jgi:hypothetical protein
MKVSAWRAILGRLRGNALNASDVTAFATNVFAFIIAHCRITELNTGLVHFSNQLGSARRRW